MLDWLVIATCNGLIIFAIGYTIARIYGWWCDRNIREIEDWLHSATQPYDQDKEEDL